MSLRWGLCFLILWGVGTLAALLLHSEGIREEAVHLALADGTAIHGVLYRSTDSTSTKPTPAALVLHGLATSHRSCEVALIHPLVRMGFIVLAIDLQGHGRSGGSLPESWFSDLDRILEMRVELPEVAEGLRFLRSRAEVDGRHVCLLGHSLGGLAAVNTACSDEEVASVVAISVAPQICDIDNPKNLLLLAGDLDRLISPSRFQQALRRATGGRLEECAVPFGRFKQGTARELWVAHWVGHLSPLFDPCSSRRALLWASLSVGREPGFISCARLISIDCAVLFATMAGIIAAVASLKKGAQFLLPVSTPMEYDVPHIPNPPIVKHRAAIALALCALAVPVAVFSGELLPKTRVLFGGATAILYALIALAWFAAGKPIAIEREKRSTYFKTLLRGAMLGILGFGVSLAWLGFPLGATWLDLTPYTPRSELGSLYLLLFLPWSFVLSHGIQRVLPYKNRWSAIYRGLTWLAIALASWLGNELFNGLQPFFGISVSLLGASFLFALPLWLLPDRCGMMTARSFCQAFSAAWILACHQPFVHAG
jgi:pimeloyl-ACP methyl ester carboxylesterase